MREERVRSRVRRDAVTPAPRRLRGDRGGTLAEAAILTPVYVMLLFGVLEFGGAFRDYLTLNNATTAAARQASISANSIDADYQVVQAIAKESSALPQNEILKIVIYHAATPSDPPSAGCLLGTATSGSGSPGYVGACNTYNSNAFGWGSANSNWGCGATAKDRFWCPTFRKSAQTGINGPPDFVGVYIQIRHPYITGLFGTSIVMSKTDIIKIEPQSLQ
jgi:Flp pilus assembly protein TadG